MIMEKLAELDENLSFPPYFFQATKMHIDAFWILLFSPKHMPLDASKRFQQMMIESAVKRALDKQSLAEVIDQ